MMTPGDQPEFIGPNFHGPYTKLVRHVSAVHELLCSVPTNIPGMVGTPSTPAGLTAEQRSRITMHIEECMDMIGQFEWYMTHPAVIVTPKKQNSP